MSLETALKDALLPYPDHDVVIAVSGGQDSMTLCHVAAHTLPRERLCIVHVWHDWQAMAGEWAALVEQTAQTLGVTAHIVKTPPIQPALGDSLEAHCRALRYQHLRPFVSERTVLLTAHHQADQAETFLLGAMRGLGPEGLQGIRGARPFGQGTLLRPWLDCTKASIEAYARQHQLQWVRDPSNEAPRFARNRLRHQVLPIFAQQFESIEAQLAQAATVQAEAAELCHALAKQDAQGTLALPLEMTPLRELSDTRALNVLRYALQAHQLPNPSKAQLATFWQQCRHAAIDKRPQLHWEGITLTRYQQHLYVHPTLVPAPRGFQWEGEPWESPSGIRLTAHNLPDGWSPDRYPVQVRFRGELESEHKKVKRWMNANRVLPWWRDHVPLLWSDSGFLTGILQGHNQSVSAR